MRTSIGCVLVSLAIASACTAGDPAVPANRTAEAPGAGGPPTAAVTFHGDVAPILRRVCQSCHVEGGIAPFALVTYADAKPLAGAIASATRSRRMPPWGAQTTEECQPPHPWKNDLRLSDAEIATLEAWHAGGDVEGIPPADASPPNSQAPALRLANALAVAPPPFDLQATKDVMQCFVLDPAIVTKTWLNGTHFVPGNPTIVHHALTFAVPPGATTPVDDDPSKPYECFGGPRVDGASLVAAWAPGGVPSDYPPNVGLPLEPGTRFVMQVHYHPHSNATKAPDATTFQYRLTQTPPEWTARQVLAGNFRKAPGEDPKLPAGAGLLPGTADPGSGVEFRIPAGATGHVETMTFSIGVPIPVRLAGLGAHMHLAGRDAKITLKPKAPGAAPVCLLQEPAWDFDWQRGYEYDVPVESLPVLQPGDTVEVRCTYDNTMQRPQLAAALREAGLAQPKDIFLGEATTDEMCLGAFMFLYKLP